MIKDRSFHSSFDLLLLSTMGMVIPYVSSNAFVGDDH